MSLKVFDQSVPLEVIADYWDENAPVSGRVLRGVLAGQLSLVWTPSIRMHFVTTGGRHYTMCDANSPYDTLRLVQIETLICSRHIRVEEILAQPARGHRAPDGYYIVSTYSYQSYLGATKDRIRDAVLTLCLEAGGMEVQPLTDSDAMPFGKFKGVAMGDVPATYLDWLSGQKWLTDWPRVKKYIESNRKQIDAELDSREEYYDG